MKAELLGVLVVGLLTAVAASYTVHLLSHHVAVELLAAGSLFYIFLHAESVAFKRLSSRYGGTSENGE